MKNYHHIFEEDGFYHIFNRGNNKENIFINYDNYNFYKYNSYNAIISKAPTQIKRKDVIDLFGDLNNFIEYHKMMLSYEGINHLLIE